MRVIKRSERMLPSEFEYDVADDAPSLEEMLVADEESIEVLTAFRELDEMCQQLIRLLAVEPPLSYEEISEIMDRPIGSLGPTRGRCIDRLKANIARISTTDGDSSR